MPLLLRENSHIVVADHCPRDYHGLTSHAGEYAWNLHFLINGQAVVQFPGWHSVDLWLVNAQLPDISGLDLLRMLGERVRPSRVFIVADQYFVEQERAACAVGAGLYVCKGVGRKLDCAALFRSLHGMSRSREPTGDP